MGCTLDAHNRMYIIYGTLVFFRRRQQGTLSEGGSGIAEARDEEGPNSTGLCLEYRILVLMEGVLSDGGGRV